MTLLILRAYLMLIYFDLVLARSDFRALYEKAHNCRVRSHVLAHDVEDRVCSAVDWACIWYWKEVLCLERSAVTSCLLRSRGIFSQMVIGTQQLPFKAHAWVEVDGRVVGDKPYVKEMYVVLDRC